MPSLLVLVSAVLILSCRQNHTHTEADDRYTHANTVGMSTVMIAAVAVMCGSDQWI